MTFSLLEERATAEIYQCANCPQRMLLPVVQPGSEFEDEDSDTRQFRLEEMSRHNCNGGVISSVVVEAIRKRANEMALSVGVAPIDMDAPIEQHPPHLLQGFFSYSEQESEAGAQLAREFKNNFGMIGLARTVGGNTTAELIVSSAWYAARRAWGLEPLAGVPAN